MLRRRTLYISVATILVLGVGAYVWTSGWSSPSSSAQADAKSQPVPVTTVTAKLGTLPRIIAGIGVVQPLQSVTIRARIDGQVTDVSFGEGEPITDWCDARRLGVTARVRLLLKVCEAVQFAHHLPPEIR